MAEEIEKIELPTISEFLDIYPPISKDVNNNINPRQFFPYFGPIKLKSRKSIEKFRLENPVLMANSYPFLIEKILKQQKKKIVRTPEVKDAIKNFLTHSNLIQKLQTYFSTQNNDNHNNLVNLEEHINTVINKLTDSVILEKYDENKTIIRYGDIGQDCYFLLSGKTSILKPVEYKGITIGYHDYLKYLSNLYANDEMFILLKVIELNNDTFFKFHKLEEIRQDINYLKYFIKSYCTLSLYYKLITNKIECTDISKIKENLKEFNLSLKDFNIEENVITENINKIQEEHKTNINKGGENKNTPAQIIKKYILEIFTPSEDERFNMKPYDKLLFKNDLNNHSQNNNNNTAILYKYDLFLYLGPGAFFGEMSLEINSTNKKRNATIRTEEECFVFSLTQKLYNSILVSSINLIKEYDISFLKRNYFFNQISPKNFDKLYFPMFKLLSKEKNEMIYKQNQTLNSIYFLKEGKVKFEINVSIIEIYNLISFYIHYLSENRRLFNFTDEQIYEMNKNYLDNKDELYLGNKPPIFKDKINEIKKYEIYNVINYETIGLLEFMSLKEKYCTSCCVVSKNAKLFEINTENMNILLNREDDIRGDYYKFAKNRFLMMIERLHSIKYNCLSNIFYKIKQNFFFGLEHNIDDYTYSKKEEKNYLNKEENYGNDSNDQKLNIYNTDNNNTVYNLKYYQNIISSPKKDLVKIKKIKLPYTNRNNNQHLNYLGNESQKNNNSVLSFRTTRFNDKYFIKHKNKYINNINNISKNNESISNKSKFNESYANIIKTLLPIETKKKSSEKMQNISKPPLKLKKIKYRSTNILNIGKNNYFTLEQLKSKFKGNNLDKSVLDLSIVKYENKSTNKSLRYNYQLGKLNPYAFNKISFSPSYFHNKKLKKIMISHNINTKNISLVNSSSNITINSNNNTVKK